MKLLELLQNVVFPADVKFVSQDEDGVINTYDSDPLDRSTTRYWTCRNFIGYLMNADDEDIHLPLAEDYLISLLVVVDGKVVGLADGCAYAPPKEPTEFTIKLSQEDFEYMHDGLEIAELTAGIVNQILKEQGVNITFSIEENDDVED